MSKWELIRPFVVILVLHAVGIYLFTRGFLLTRTELPAYSNCTDAAAHSPCAAIRPAGGAEEPRCWTRPAVGRVVIIVLDALRFDFMAPSTFFEEAKPWMDKLRVLQKLASGEGSSSRIFKAIADPPTTSLQRLKGLTTGGLPTFIDVGNSFGAPAITEDNLIYQLVKNGKRVLMMGDDTWLQLFPDFFQKSFPYPSFNVKDLDTVDNGAYEHLLPSLHEDDWDVLIAHFLGVDHAGHIFGVDSSQMIDKLEQYNSMLEVIVEVLKNQSFPGGLHDNTLLMVMGDHGQTLNGDHGGGTAEEVETSLFAMSLKSPPSCAFSLLDSGSCNSDLDGEKMCISTFQQLDFAATLASLLGVPLPFGSIGRVNSELYALSGGTWDDPSCAESCSSLELWMQNYARTLCINSWQVKRYIDLYSAMSLIGLPPEDLHRVAKLYNLAQADWSDTVNSTFSCNNEAPFEIQRNSCSILMRQIDAYADFLQSVAELARSAWTEFNVLLMGAGLGIMLISIFIHISALRRLYILFQSYYFSSLLPCARVRLIFALSIVAIRSASFLSNSYILEEGRVANFLLGTTGIFNLLQSIGNGNFLLEEFAFLILNLILRLGIEFGVSKQAITSASDLQFLGFFGIDEGYPLMISIGGIILITMLSILGFILYKSCSAINRTARLTYITVIGTIVSYMIIAIYWIFEDNVISTKITGAWRNLPSQLVYAIGFLSLVSLVLSKFFDWQGSDSKQTGRVLMDAVAMISACSSTVIMLLGKQGPFVALLVISGAWCIIRSHAAASIFSTTRNSLEIGFNHISLIQWALLGACLFFYTGHWCNFDGLRYGAAFIGFDDFHIIRQGILLSIDTFGVSHIIPILGLPFLVILGKYHSKSGQLEGSLLLHLTEVFLCYGLITTMTCISTILCVTIHRRHLMVWGLFAPKYVFDVIGLLVTDTLIFLASLYYY